MVPVGARYEELVSIYMKTFEDSVKNINDETQYWLVRTMGGDFYKHYTDNDFIAIGYNEITLQDFKTLSPKKEIAKKVLQEMFKARREDANKARYAASQMYRFVREMKIGDIVIIPSSSSHKVAFGRIDSDVYEDSTNIYATYGCPFAKRRKITWLKTSIKTYLPAELQLIFGSRHIISEITGYGAFIDQYLNDFYTKGDKTFLVLRVKQQDELSADDFTLISDLMSLFNDFSEETKWGITSKDIKMKASVQSPGDILLFAQSPWALAIIGLIILFLKGGNYNLDIFNVVKLNLNLPSTSQGIALLIDKLNKLLNDSSKRKLMDSLKNKLDNMEIDAPDAIAKLLPMLQDTPDKDEEKNDE